jgi:hypothetical protein
VPELQLPAGSDVLALLPPAGAALLLVLGGWWLGRRSEAPVSRWLAAAGALAIGVAYAWIYVRVKGAPGWPPRGSTERGMFAVAAAAAVATVWAAVPFRLWRGVPHLVVAPLVAAAVSGGIAEGAMTLPWLAVAAIAVFAFSYLLDRAAVVGMGSPVFGLAIALSVGALGQVWFMFGSALLAQLAGALAMSSAVIAIASAAFRRPLLAPDAALPIAAAVAALSIDARLFLYQPPPMIAVILLAVAPLGAAVPFIAVRRRRPGGVAIGLIALAFALLLTGLGFFLAWRVAPEPYF